MLGRTLKGNEDLACVNIHIHICRCSRHCKFFDVAFTSCRIIYKKLYTNKCPIYIYICEHKIISLAVLVIISRKDYTNETYHSM